MEWKQGEDSNGLKGSAGPSGDWLGKVSDGLKETDGLGCWSWVGAEGAAGLDIGAGPVGEGCVWAVLCK